MTLYMPCQTDRHAGACGVSRSRVLASCGHGLGNDVPLLLLALIPHIVRGIGILNVLIARLREPQETVGALTPLMVHRASWEHVQVVHVETDKPEDAIGFGETPCDDTLQRGHVTAVPRLMVLLRQVSHLHQHVDGCDHIRTSKDVSDRSDNTGIVGVLPIGVDCHLFHGLSSEPHLVEQVSPRGTDGVLVHRDVSCNPCCEHPCRVRQQGSSQTRMPPHVSASSSGNLAGALMDRHSHERLPHALLAPPVGHGRGTSRGIRLDHQGAHGFV